MDVGGGFVQDVHQQFDETVGDDFVVVVVAQLERVVEENVRFVFVVIRIDNLFDGNSYIVISQGTTINFD